MSEQSDPREQVEASPEQDVELKDLGVGNEEADQVRGGKDAAPAPKPTPKPNPNPNPNPGFELGDVSFG